MYKLAEKSLLIGFIVGTVFLGIAPLGLGIRFVEILKPILAPGIVLFHPLWENTSGSLRWMFALVLNGLVYSAFFFAVLSVKEYIKNRNS